MKLIYTFVPAIIIAMFLFPATVAGQGNTQAIKIRDSLQKIIPSLKGEEKLSAYKKLCMLPFSLDELDWRLALSDEVIKEAMSQNNLQSAGDAIFDKMVQMCNNGMRTKIYGEVDGHLDFFRQNNQWENYYGTFLLLIESYIYNKNYETALRKAQELYDREETKKSVSGMETVSYLLGSAYVVMGRPDEAEKFFRESIAQSNDPDRFTNSRRFAHERLCQVLLKKEKFNEALVAAEELNALYTNFNKKNPGQIRSAQQFAAMYYRINAEAYRGLGDYQKVLHYCNLTEEILPNDPMAMSYVFYTRARTNEELGLYRQALDEYDKSSACYMQFRPNVPTIVLTDKARALCKAGRGEEAYPIYEAIIDSSETLSQRILNSRIDELRTLYETDRHIAEKERNRNYFLFALAGCAILAVALGIWIYYNRKIARKNRALVQQIRELTAQQELRETELLNKTVFVEEMDDDYDDPCSENRKDKLCIAIRDIILKEKIYLDPTLSRDHVINRLGTSRHLFTDAFQSCFGIPFSDYINNLRLKDALMLLEQTDLPIEDISEQTGFGTLRTFQRQFQKKYNMSPKDYRNSARSEP